MRSEFASVGFRLRPNHGLKAALTAAAISIAMAAAPAARAAQVFDQVNLAPTDQGMLASSGIGSANRQVQTVTAGVAGILSTVEMQVWNVAGAVSNAGYRLSIYDGDYAQAASGPNPGGHGTLVGSIVIPISSLPTYEAAQAGLLAIFDVSSFGFHVAPGQVFSLLSEVTDPTGAVSQALGYYPDPSDTSNVVNLDYDRGYNSATFFTDQFTASGADRGFMTMVDVGGVPEPSAWMMMIGGLALVGGMARRRPPALSAA